MNRRLAQTYTGFAAAIVAIVAMLTWWQVIEAGSLRTREFNQQYAYYEQRIERGPILARGVELAKSTAVTGPDGDTIYERSYPRNGLAAHAVGYYTQGRSRTGIERTYNDVLSRSNDRLAELLETIRGEDERPGDTVHMALLPGPQQTAVTQLDGRAGAAIAMDPKTGAILAMASAPTFNPNDVLGDGFERLTQRDDAALLNRATQSGYVPGSTFKLVTATAALEQDIATPDRVFPGGCEYETAGPPIRNFGGACTGPNTLAEALQRSINTTFAQLGEEVGTDDMREQMRRFGLEVPPELSDLDASEVRVGGLTDADGNVLPADTVIDDARLGIGQERLQLSPLNMVRVVATIANDGVPMRPYLVDRVETPTGRVKDTTSPEELDVAMSPGTAAQMTEMMIGVTEGGTGTAAALPGIEVAGKTGTADTPQGNQIWFVGFAPADDPQVAVAVTLEAQSTGVTGGGAAAPIARAIMADILGISI